MIRRFALQNVEPAPNSIARMMTRIYCLSWDAIAFFDTFPERFFGDRKWML
jgi:hypothetical protein